MQEIEFRENAQESQEKLKKAGYVSKYGVYNSRKKNGQKADKADQPADIPRLIPKMKRLVSAGWLAQSAGRTPKADISAAYEFRIRTIISRLWQPWFQPLCSSAPYCCFYIFFSPFSGKYASYLPILRVKELPVILFCVLNSSNPYSSFSFIFAIFYIKLQFSCSNITYMSII